MTAARDAERAAVLKANGGKPHVEMRWIEEPWPYPKFMAAERARMEAENKENTSGQDGEGQQDRDEAAEAGAGETESSGENNKQNTRSWMEWDEPGWIRPQDKSPGEENKSEGENKQNTSGQRQADQPFRSWIRAAHPRTGTKPIASVVEATSSNKEIPPREGRRQAISVCRS